MTVVIASGAGVRHRRRWVFRGLDVTVTAGETVAVVGPPGSGRTTVLLALAGRFRLSAGTIRLSGTGSLAHLPDVAEPEPVMTVAECVRERLAVLGRYRGETIDLGGLDPQRKAWQLRPYEKQVLGLILAGLGEPAVIALDGVDEGLDAGEQAALWERVGALTEAGIAVIVTARTVDPACVSTVIQLGVEGETTVEPARGDLAPDEAVPDEAMPDEVAPDEVAPDEAALRDAADDGACGDGEAARPDDNERDEDVR